ncbi:MAG: hypothetical protein IJ323_00755 [Clostridia bacterium]|nr:hypothetical protein [Clostridia bacterium]
MTYTGEYLREIVFPLGGIGSGSIGLSGNGSLVDFEIFNRPDKGSINGYTFFAIKAEYPNGESVTKVLQGDQISELQGRCCNGVHHGFGHGYESSSMCGFPHFSKVKFDGKFPIATISFEDKNFPAKIKLKAFNPFIPLDSDNSSIPAAFFDISVINNVKNVKYTVLFSVRNPFKNSINEKIKSDKYTAANMRAGIDCDDKEYGDMTVAVDVADGICYEYWQRGPWREPVTTFWHDITTGTLPDRHYEDAGNGDICTVGASALVNGKKGKSFKFVLSWNVPNNYNYWNPLKNSNGRDVTFKNYYTKLFENSQRSAFYCLDKWDYLYRKTNDFCKILHSSSLDKSVLDAVTSNLAVLKSATTLRLEDGTFYGWEDLHEKEGSCEGTCTHVWSYAYALPFLFPDLERSIRDTEFKYNVDEKGLMQFRTAPPIGREHEKFLPCLDGQMAAVIKIYRDWKLTGNSEWLKKNWGNVKRILEFAWSENNPFEWDRNRDGVLEGRQHHTLDMELFGPSSWLEGMYLAALKAASEMAEFLGDGEKREEYNTLFEKGYAWTKENLFNGEYFIQKIDLKDKTQAEHFHCENYWDDERNELKYQIGDGCAINQMLSQWHANISGLGDIFDKNDRSAALKNVFKNNFYPSLREFANAWRIFALNDEGGTVMCSYPEGKVKPIISISYADECMSGFEYAFAGLLISEGFINEGIEIVTKVRERYDGQKRNPYSEIECGQSYAMSMASFALIPIFSGFEFDLPRHHIGFSPALSGNFKSFWSTGTAWGDFIKIYDRADILIKSGKLTLSSVSVGINNVKSVWADSKKIDFEQKGKVIYFKEITVKKELLIEV